MQEYCRCYALISLQAITKNIENIRKRIPKDTKLLAVLKADAYGHGAAAVGKHIEDKIDLAGVASVQEGIELRRAGIKKPVLILGYSSELQFDELIRHSLMPTIYSLEDAKKLSQAAERSGAAVGIHIAVDTGMTRIGFGVSEESADIIKEISELNGIRTEGIFSHLSCADMRDDGYSLNQLKEFDRMLSLLKERGVDINLRHICNSAGIMKYTDSYFECVRAGIIMYGLYPSDEINKDFLNLTPAMEWKAHVIHVQEIQAGRGVSYGASYVTGKPNTRIAALSVGYADGYPRNLSSKGSVLIRGKRVPITGRVCMDIMMVDVTNIPDVCVGDTATLIGRDGDEIITVEEVASLADSFNYEMVCRVSKRVKRIYVS